MHRYSAVVDSSGKWVPAEEILTSHRNQVLSRPTSSFLSDWGVDASTTGKQAENAPASRRRDQPPLSYHPSASSASALSYLTSQPAASPLSPIRLDNRIPLVPVRRSVQPEQMLGQPESGDSMLPKRALGRKRSSSAPAMDRIAFPQPQPANPYAQSSQDAYRAISAPAPRIETAFASSVPQIALTQPFSTQIAHEGMTQHTADNVYPPTHQQGYQIISPRGIRPEAFVAIDPFHPQLYNKYEKDLSTFDDIPSPEQQRQQSSIRPYSKPVGVPEPLGPLVTNVMASITTKQDAVQPREHARHSSSDSHAFVTIDDNKNAKEKLLPEGQIPEQQKRLAPNRRSSDMGHKPHEGSLENYAPYPWKPPLPSTHSLPQSFSYGLNANADTEKPNKSLWAKLSGYLTLPFSSRSKESGGRYSFSAPYIHPPSTPSISSNPSRKPGHIRSISNFVLKVLPAQIYLLFLLRVPSFYFSRVARIFEEADMSLPEIKKMVLEMMALDRGYGFDDGRLQAMGAQEPEKAVPSKYRRLKLAWEGFVEDVVSEWKMFNVIAVVLLFVILTTIQIESTSATADPVVRYTALCSLICALMSLAFGCVFVLHFGAMRKIWKAAEWALEAKKTKVFIWWNAWVMLAMPVVWLSWSVILYITSVMTFVWRTSSQAPGSLSTHGISHAALLGVRVAISVLLGLGVVYMLSAMYTFRRYGDKMDKNWRKRVGVWVREMDQEKSRALNEYKTWRPSLSAAPVSPGLQSTTYGLDERRNHDPEGFLNSMPKPDVKVANTIPAQQNYNQPVQSPSKHQPTDNLEKSYHANQHDKGKVNGFLEFGPQTATSSQTSPSTQVHRVDVASKPNFSKDLNKSDPPPVSAPNGDLEDADPAHASASARRRTKTASLAIPPPSTLPPIPGTPMSGISGPRSRSVRTNTTLATTASSFAAAERSFRHFSDFNLNAAKNALADTDGDTRMGQHRELSPMASMSAIGSEYLGSELSNDESEVISDGSKSMSVPWTPFPSPVTASPK
ncbi:hypothetical protein JR316_0008423 [Psilocybe cubensis]|uniref:Uncharacterized protein n=2 Tax=Psilocybe cubensis TaxID=181762 RepID=A0ACB8GW26_PSICU|nr:hypothetical protein JR316_0008423 [Psilocybe cubensis]KAH9479828.1 hypothetical protein JR316_0008423 [Psilocybe cubensis]